MKTVGPYRFKRSYRKRTTKTAKRTPKTTSKMVATRGYVKRLIHSNVENKTQQYIGLNQSISPLTGFSLNILPQLSQGTNQVNRIGNEVTVKKGIIRGLVNLLPYNSVTNPLCIQRVRVMVLSMKEDNGGVLSTTGIWQYGSSALDLQANLGDTMYGINKDKFVKYYDKTFVLGSPSQSSLTNNLAGQHFSNDKFQVPFYCDFSKHIKSKLKYNDSTTICTNRNMFLWITSVNADGTATAVTPAEAHVFLDLQFEDA